MSYDFKLYLSFIRLSIKNPRNNLGLSQGPIQDAFRTLDWRKIREKLRDLESVLGIDPA